MYELHMAESRQEFLFLRIISLGRDFKRKKECESVDPTS